jgi:hypothetical protein
MATVLLSLCNLKRNGVRFPLIVGSLERRRFGLVDCASWIVPPDTGVTGLLATEEAIYVCVQGHESGRVVVLDPDLSLRAVVADDRFHDLHSIKRLGDEICVVSTGNSRLFTFSPDDLVVRERWAFEHADGRLHINDVGLHDGRVHVLSHVHPRYDGHGRSGAVWDLESREVLIGGLKHPHSLVDAGDVLHCLSSAAGQLVSRNWASGAISKLKLGGYLRGLAATESGFVVGQSSTRFYSRKRGPAVNPVDLESVIGNPKFMSSLGEVSGRKFGRRHNLTHLGLEIYDVVVATVDYDALVEKNSAQLRAQSLYQRIAELEMLLDAQDGGPESGKDPEEGDAAQGDANWDDTEPADFTDVG